MRTRRIAFMTPSELEVEIKNAVKHLRHECNLITVNDVMAVCGFDLPSLSPFEALVFSAFARDALEANGYAPVKERNER